MIVARLFWALGFGGVGEVGVDAQMDSTAGLSTACFVEGFCSGGHSTVGSSGHGRCDVARLTCSSSATLRHTTGGLGGCGCSSSRGASGVHKAIVTLISACGGSVSSTSGDDSDSVGHCTGRLGGLTNGCDSGLRSVNVAVGGSNALGTGRRLIGGTSTSALGSLFKGSGSFADDLCHISHRVDDSSCSSCCASLQAKDGVGLAIWVWQYFLWYGFDVSAMRFQLYGEVVSGGCLTIFFLVETGGERPSFYYLLKRNVLL